MEAGGHRRPSTLCRRTLVRGGAVQALQGHWNTDGRRCVAGRILAASWIPCSAADAMAQSGSANLPDPYLRSERAQYQTYGERLLRPVEAMFYRVQAQGRGYDSPACAWPPNWAAVSRLR